MFLAQAVKNRFFELCRVYDKWKNEALLDKEVMENTVFDRNQYADVEFYVDLDKIKKCNITNQRKSLEIYCIRTGY